MAEQHLACLKYVGSFREQGALTYKFCIVMGLGLRILILPSFIGFGSFLVIEVRGSLK